MDEGTTAIASELEAPAIERQAPATEDDGFYSPDLEADVNGEGNEEQTVANAAELFDIELDGETLKVPGKFRDAFMKSADYTQKTQAAAEERRQIAEERKQIELRSQATNEELEARGVLFQIDNQLQQMQQRDWQRFHAEDPMGANAEWMRFQQLKEARSAISGKLEESQQNRLKDVTADYEKRLDETAAFAQKDIKGWTPQLDNEIHSFAMKDLGLSLEEIKSSLNPRFYKGLYLAYVGSKALQRQGTSKPAQTTVQPLTTVSTRTGGSASKPLGEMSMDEYAEHMNGREAARAKVNRR